MKLYIEVKVETLLGGVRRRTIPVSKVLYVTENSKGNARIATTFTAGLTGRILGFNNLPCLDTVTTYDDVIKQLNENEVKLCKK